MRKAIFGVVVGALLFAAVAYAATQSNTVQYSSTIKYKGKATKKHPKNVLYEGVLHVGTSDNKQPDTATYTDLFFARQLRNNGAKFKSCKKTTFDAKGSIPASCNKAIVGDGTAKALLGKPGNKTDGSAGSSFLVPLQVKAINGPKGKTLFLAVNGGAATGNTWRAIPGAITKIKKGRFGFKVRFKVPKELEFPAPGSQVALTDFDVKIKTSRKVKKKSYLQLTTCPKSKKLPTLLTNRFNQDDGSPGGGTVSNRGLMPCH